MKAPPLQALIVNADDFGLTEAVNRAIEASHAAGVVTSTSMIVNQAASGAVTALAARNPRLGIGLHLALTIGQPISDPGAVRSLVDADGRFHPREAMIELLHRGQVARADVVTECGAQLARVRELGVEPDHWNVHQHLGEHVALGEVVSQAMFDLGLRVARNPRRVRIASALSPSGLAAMERARRRRRGERAITALHTTPDGLLDARPSDWVRLLPGLNGGVIEAICHPGEAHDAELVRLAPRFGTLRAEDLVALLDPRLHAAMVERDVPLSTFGAAFAAGAHGR
jgi:predicted glycoside hydrolase/deacetylase ChbG (UPF0249 family)